MLYLPFPKVRCSESPVAIFWSQVLLLGLSVLSSSSLVLINQTSSTRSNQVEKTDNKHN
jgi:hypothetical protein